MGKQGWEIMGKIGVGNHGKNRARKSWETGLGYHGKNRARKSGKTGLGYHGKTGLRNHGKIGLGNHGKRGLGEALPLPKGLETPWEYRRGPKTLHRGREHR